MKLKAVLCIVFISILSCKEEKKENEVVTEPMVVETNNTDNYFSLSIEATIENDDDFILYYLEGEETDITKKNSVPVKITGNSAQQKLNFRLKEEILPTRLIIKYGNEQKAQKIQFYGAEITYLGEKIVMDSYKFYQFFIPNEYIDYDQKEHIAVSKESDGKYEPIFFSRKVLEEKINYTFY